MHQYKTSLFRISMTIPNVALITQSVIFKKTPAVTLLNHSLCYYLAKPPYWGSYHQHYPSRKL